MLIGIKERLTGAMLRLIKEERDNQQINPHLIKNCLQCYGIASHPVVKNLIFVSKNGFE